MKASIAISFLILAGAAVLGWSDRQRLTAARASHAELVAEAGKLGITAPDAAANGSHRVTKRERADRDAEARAAAIEFIAFAKEMEAIQKDGGQPDEAIQKRVMDFMERMMSLDAAQLKLLIAEVRVAKDLKDETRQGLIGFSIMTLATDHPQAALTIFTESADLFKESGMGNHVISSALTRWAKDDPLAAVDWVRKHGAKFPELVTSDAKLGLISGAAVQDPKLAFKLIGELGIKEDSQAVSRIIDAAKTPEERSAMLQAVRDYGGRETAEQAMHNLGANVMKDGFQAATSWISAAGLNQEELGKLADGFQYSQATGDESGRWVEWIGEHLPTKQSDAKIRNIVSQWTQNDYQAAGKWLAAAPDGPAKHASIHAYAETISKYEPEAAAKWAETLPQGKEREELLKQIHDHSLKNDSATKEQGLK